MTSWSGGWGWCSAMVNNSAMLLLLSGAVFTAFILTVRSAVRGPSDPPALSPYWPAPRRSSCPHSPKRTRQ